MTITNWLNSMSWEVAFYQRTPWRRRVDGEMDWRSFDRSRAGRLFTLRRYARKALRRAGFKIEASIGLDWLHANGALLWETRRMLIDELSRLLFDSALVVRLTSHRQFYFPRIDFDDVIAVNDRRPFKATDLPIDYLGIPLNVYEVEYRRREAVIPFKLISTEPQIAGVNSYRQYLVERDGFDVSPRRNEVVLDCGACIGDYSILFAALVGEQGQVHAFDPIPLHNRFCSLQASLNPSLAGALHFNALAVGNRTSAGSGVRHGHDRIIPGQVKDDSFDCTTLDDYAKQRLTRLDYIKMDIEGSELEAITGASAVIQSYKPRLAISVYHKPEDLWEIPHKLKDLNPNYEFMFGHHSPVHWESVLYAIQRAR